MVLFQLFDPTKCFIQWRRRISHKTYLPELQASPSPGNLTGLGSTLHKEIELFSKEPSILFDLSKVSQVNSQALNLNLPFNSSTSTF